MQFFIQMGKGRIIVNIYDNLLILFITFVCCVGLFLFYFGVCVCFFFFNTLLILCGKFGPPYLGYSSRNSSSTQSYKCMLDLFVYP